MRTTNKPTGTRSSAGMRRAAMDLALVKGALAVAVLAILSGGLPGCGQAIVLGKFQCDSPGRRVPDGEVPQAADVALDAYCAQVVAERSAPEGYVTIFGSARAKEGMLAYDQTREFARVWTEKYGQRHPILTGGGPGIMEAGNRGAHEAGGASLGFSSYFGQGNEPLNPYTTDGYVFASFAQREADMIDRAVALVAASGGVGTEWEIYESLAKIQTGKKESVPLVLLGPPAVWNSLLARLKDMAARGTIAPDDLNLLQVAPTPADAVKLIEQALNQPES